MNLLFLLTPEERGLYEYHIDSHVRHGSAVVWMTMLGYVICTLLFFDHLTVKEHVIFGMSVLLFSASLHLYTFLLKVGKLKRPSYTISLLVIVLVRWVYVAGWCTYFYVLVQKRDAPALQQFVIIQAMSSILSIAMVGRFQRVVIADILIILVFMTLTTWIEAPQMFQQLMLPIYVLGLSKLLFLRALNQQLFDLFRVKNVNIELVDALKQKNIALEQANLAQSRYLSAASHDLRQPLHALALLVSDAQRKNKQADVSLILSKIEQAIDSLSSSFNAMLNLSRLDAGVVKPDIQAIPLQRIFDRIQIEFEETARHKGLELTIVSTKVWIQSDEGMLHSILSNFVSNAVRYTESGKVLLGVRHLPDNKIKILVFDTGTGVPSEKAKQIFHEYKRLEYAEQRVKGGVGLGLAISERMAKLLGTQLFVQSAPGKGSCFGLIMQSIPKPISLEFKQNERDVVGDYLSGKRIAIVDDDETAVDYLAELLSSWNLDVSIVLSSDMLREVIEEEGSFDVILSDFHLGLSDETGLDVLIKACQLQSERKPICILITGDTSAELAQAVRSCDIEILYKPLSPVRLRASLNTLLRT